MKTSNWTVFCSPRTPAEIDGPTVLHGDVRVAGAKNAALPLMAASLLVRGRSRITNVPDLRDTRFFLDLLRELDLITIGDR